MTPSFTRFRQITSRMITPSADGDTGHRIRSSASERARTSGMRCLVDEAPISDDAHFVYAIGEQISPVVEPDHRLAQRQIASVHIGNS